MNFRLISMMALASIALVSCNDDDEETNGPDQGTPSYTVPATYSFTDAAGNNTVAFDGQTDRLNQLEEMTVLMKSANTPGNAVDADALKAMFANENGDGNGNFSFSSTKQLKNKCASTFIDAAEIQMEFETMMEDLAAASQTTTTGQYDGAPGTAGVVSTDNSGPYLMSADGVEYVQLIEKGLMGAVFYHQITAYYLSDEKIGDQVDNSTPRDPENGQYYTDMEHHWDEAFGYFSTATNFPDNSDKRFWAKYSTTVDAQLGTNEIIMDAFLTGRAAIANGDMTTKEEMRDIIIAELEKVSAGTAIHYLNDAVASMTDDAARNHVLSEAWAFLDNLKFNPNSTVPPQTITTLKNELGADFYNVSVTDIISVRDQLGSMMGFTTSQIENL